MKLPNLQPKHVQQPRDAPDGFPNKSFLALLYSSKGTGKTNTLVNIVREYEKHKFFQKIYLFSPSIHSDPKYELLRNGKYILREYDNFTNEYFAEALEEITNDLALWKKYERVKKVFDKFNKIRHPTAKHLQSFSDEEIAILEEHDFEMLEAPFEREPYTFIIFDDLASNKQLMSNGKSAINSFLLLHRHKLCSVAFCTQIFRNAVPKMVRNNLDWYVLGPSKSDENMKSVAEELTSYATDKELMAMWDKATAEPFHYFCINLMVPKYRFTRNFDEPIQ